MLCLWCVPEFKLKVIEVTLTVDILSWICVNCVVGTTVLPVCETGKVVEARTRENCTAGRNCKTFPTSFPPSSPPLISSLPPHIFLPPFPLSLSLPTSPLPHSLISLPYLLSLPPPLLSWFPPSSLPPLSTCGWISIITLTLCSTV